MQYRTIVGNMQKHPQLVALGKQIRALRDEYGYSQDSFAIEAGLDRSYYGSIERGEYNVTSLNLIKIASTLGVEVGDLFPSIKTLKKAK